MFKSAESEHPRLTNGEIICEEFQPIWSQTTNVTEGQTDNMRSQDRVLHYIASRGKNWNVPNLFGVPCGNLVSAPGIVVTFYGLTWQARLLVLFVNGLQPIQQANCDKNLAAVLNFFRLTRWILSQILNVDP